MSKFKRLFWDLETSPNIGFFWKASKKQWIPYDNVIREKAIICICYKWEGQKTIHSLTWDDGDDEQLVRDFWPILEEADELVAHNGDKFDLKWFNSQCLQYGLPGIPDTKTVDTLAIARRRFYLNSNRLDYLGSLLLDRGKEAAPFELWTKIVLDNDQKALAQLVKYCKADVQLLEEIYQKLMPFHNPKSHMGVFEGKPRWTCPHCASESVRRKKRRVTAKGMVQHGMVCKDCHRHYTISNTVYHHFQDNKEEST